MRSKKLIALTSSLLCYSFCLSQPGKVGINTTSPQAMLHVMDSSVVFTGPATTGSGNPPVSGPGIRLMWYPDKAAFRAGYVTGVNWDKDSIGLYSLAFCLNTKAKGYSSVAFGEATRAIGAFSTTMGSGTEAIGIYSTAMGNSTKASGISSIAMGSSTTASGSSSIAIGNFTSASGNYSTATGNLTQASGDYSTAMSYFTTATGDYSLAAGNGTRSKAYSSFVIGSYNDEIAASSPDTWVDTDPIFIIGNGTANNARSNAVTVLKDGKFGIGLSNPQRTLHILASSTGTAITPNSDAVLVVERNLDNAYISILTNANRSSGIIFGNQTNSNDGGIYYNLGINDFSLRFRTNGNITRMLLDSIGRIGIGTTTPDERLDVNGNIKVSGEINRSSTGAANLLPIAFGSVLSNGIAMSSTGNFSVINTSTGVYEITIIGEAYSFYTHQTIVTPNSSAARFAVADFLNDKLVIRIFDAAGVLSNHAFYFFVYRP
jgi:hypothetical protein